MKVHSTKTRREKYCDLEVDGMRTIVRPVAAANCLRRKLGVEVIGYDLRDGRLQASPPSFIHISRSGPRGSLVIPTGHFERAKALLVAHSFHVKTKTRKSPLSRAPMPCWSMGVNDLPHDADQLVRAISRQPSGLLYAQKDCDVIMTAAVLCNIFSKNPVLIIVRNKKAALKTAHQLSQLSLDRTICTWHELDLACRSDAILILDVQQFGWLGPGSREFPVVVVTDARLAMGSTASANLKNLSRSFRFACLRACDRLSQLEQFTLEGIFGPPLWRQTADRGSQEHFEVVFVEPPHQQAARRRMDPLERKRELIWYSATRNRFIASIAQAFASRDMAALQRLGLLLDWSPDDFGQLDCSGILILVEVIEHARQLKKLLPSCCIQADVEHIHPSRLAPSALMITTQSYAHRFGPLTAGVVLRTDGTAGQFAKYLHRPKGCVRGLLIDLADDVDAEAQRAVDCHHEEYQSLCWVNSHLPGYLRPTEPVDYPQSERPAQKGGHM